MFGYPLSMTLCYLIHCSFTCIPVYCREGLLSKAAFLFPAFMLFSTIDMIMYLPVKIRKNLCTIDLQGPEFIGKQEILHITPVLFLPVQLCQNIHLNIQGCPSIKWFCLCLILMAFNMLVCPFEGTSSDGFMKSRKHIVICALHCLKTMPFPFKCLSECTETITTNLY